MDNPASSKNQPGLSGSTGGVVTAEAPVDLGSTPQPPGPNPTAPDQPSPSPPQEVPAPAPPTPLEPETFVIPAGGPPPTPPSPAATLAENPFIPQGVIPSEGAEGVAPSISPGPPPSGSAWPRRILMTVVFLGLAVGVLLGGRFVLGLLTGVKEVSIAYWGLWENEEMLRGVVADFEKQNPAIKVTYTKQSPRQYRERLKAAINRGDGPDVFRFHNTWVPMLKNELALVPKTVMTAAEFSQTFYPIAGSNLVAGTSIFGIPMMIDGLGLYYNEELFTAAGIAKPPTTWEEVLDIAPKLTVKTDSTITTSAVALGTTGNVEHFSDIVATMMMQNGANLVEPTGKEAEETLIFYRKFANPTDPVYTWNDTLDNSIYAFAIGKVAMIFAPSWRAFDIKQLNPNLRFKIAPIPQLPGNTVTWASYWVEGVSAKSQHQEQAWKFMKYLTSRETVTKLYTEAAKTRLFGEPYARVDLASSIAEDPHVGAYVKQANSAKSFPLASRTFDNGLNDKLIKYLEDALNGLSTGSAPQAVLQTLTSGFRQVLGTYGLTSASAPSAR